MKWKEFKEENGVKTGNEDEIRNKLPKSSTDAYVLLRKEIEAELTPKLEQRYDKKVRSKIAAEVQEDFKAKRKIVLALQAKEDAERYE
ncbi:MAG: hypothetical protein Q9195_002447 [Heterodermia aff. obscurata]